ncbi:hypothetical protein F4820DRAFT_372798 [Hypoxylon rubiginosum]|uniref:Uncharacterized protein n=1 Tax=Hypoxylon rubiginosum TaxID=110542 RepID=A0ACB9YVV8_9PEZI|nr:hypothetical protein F4820DRAFT_372798 [Hypoxylon rubiginosum]
MSSIAAARETQDQPPRPAAPHRTAALAGTTAHPRTAALPRTVTSHRTPATARTSATARTPAPARTDGPSRLDVPLMTPALPRASAPPRAYFPPEAPPRAAILPRSPSYGKSKGKQKARAGPALPLIPEETTVSHTVIHSSERLSRYVRISSRESSRRIRTQGDPYPSHVAGNRAGRLGDFNARRATQPSYDSIRISAGGQRDAAYADVEAQLQQDREAQLHQELQRQWRRGRWRRRLKKFIMETLGPCFGERVATAVSDFFCAPMDRNKRIRCIVWYFLFFAVIAILVGICVAYSKGLIRGPPTNTPSAK